MDGHVAVAVRLDTAVVRHAHASEHDVVARAEGMDIESLADADVQGVVHGMVMRPVLWNL
jgi:hypothetical protein